MPMASDRPSEFVLHVLDLIAPIGGIETARFFGGTGLKHRGKQFGMVMRNQLYLMVDETSRGDFERAGMKPFSYQTRQSIVEVGRYFEVPEDVLCDAEQIRNWCRRAIGVAASERR